MPKFSYFLSTFNMAKKSREHSVAHGLSNQKVIQQPYMCTMFTCRDGKGGEVSSLAQKCYIHCLVQ